MVEPVLDDSPHARHEEDRQEHGKITRKHRIRHGKDHGQGLRKKDQGDEHEPGCDTDAASGGAGELDHRDADRVGVALHRAGQAGNHASQAVRRDRALHRAVIHRPAAAP